MVLVEWAVQMSEKWMCMEGRGVEREKSGGVE